MIDNVGGSRWITAIDLTKGYWQVPMEKMSQPKTAFVTSWGKYEFTTMPFGLVASPSTFQQLMDNIFTDTTPFASPYLDDIIIHSNTWTDHVEHLRAVFLRLREAGLRINRRKCHFATIPENSPAIIRDAIFMHRHTLLACTMDPILHWNANTCKSSW